MKYKLTDEAIKVDNVTLHRIECVTPFRDIKSGEKGGFVESENNLSQNGGCWVSGNARVSGNAQVSDNAQVKSIDDYIVFKNSWSSGRYFTWTRSNNMWQVGCFHCTGEELIKKAYADSENSGKHYEAYVKFVDELNKI